MSRTTTLKALSATNVVVPEGLSLDDLKLERVNSSAVRLDFAVLRQVWIVSGHRAELFNTVGTSELCAFIGRWQIEHEFAGGAVNWEHGEIARFLRDDTQLHRLIPR